MRPKRSLGQNFLTNPQIVTRIIDLADVSSRDTVLEIGPGRGIMTRRLSATAARVIAVEKDDALFQALEAELIPRVDLVHADVLDRDLVALAPAGAKLVANLPYNIATEVIMRLIDTPRHFKSITVMVQKEVAERICAAPGTKPYAALSVLIGAQFTAQPGFVVGPGNFFPPPKVDSMMIRLVPRPAPVQGEDLQDLKTVAFCAFNQRRKMLRNSLAGLPGITEAQLITMAEQAGIGLDQRPQELTAEDFLRLSRAFKMGHGEGKVREDQGVKL